MGFGRAAFTVLLAIFPVCISISARDKKEEAWGILRAGVHETETEKRAQAVSALRLLPADSEAAEMARLGLGDEKAEVRIAAAVALGQMHSRPSIPKLQALLSDKEPSVVLAAASALMIFHDQSAYDVYYEVLTGKRKTGKELIAGERQTLKDPKKLAKSSFDAGIGFLPFAGIGMSAFKTLRADDVSPVRAGAAERLAEDNDPQSGAALVQATYDKSWIVRAAALESIARRGDPHLLNGIIAALADDNTSVRYTAAAVVILLSTVGSSSSNKTQ